MLAFCHRDPEAQSKSSGRRLIPQARRHWEAPFLLLEFARKRGVI